MTSDYGVSDNEQKRKALLDQMQPATGDPGSAADSQMSGNTSIAGGTAAPALDTAAPAAPSWLTSTEKVNLPGWDNQRTDLDPKMEFGRYAQSKGGHLTGDDVRAFVAADPRWELGGKTGGDDPLIRVKQAELDKWKPGQSVWQDVIGDSGPGGANTAAFFNAAGDPSQGFAAPESPGPSGGALPPSLAMGGGLGGGNTLDTSLTGDPLAQIKAALAQLSAGSQQRPNMQALIDQIGRG